MEADAKKLNDRFEWEMANGRKEFAELEAERDQLKAEVEMLAESCGACMNELIDGPTTCKEEIIRIAKAALREVENGPKNR